MNWRISVLVEAARSAVALSLFSFFNFKKTITMTDSGRSKGQKFKYVNSECQNVPQMLLTHRKTHLAMIASEHPCCGLFVLFV